jgi:DNA-binding response OmpR family regulator
MDGITFIRELRSVPKFTDTPIVMITSIQTDEVRMKALEASATDFLPKRPQAMEMSVRLRNLIKLGLEQFPLNLQHIRSCGSSWRIHLAGRHREDMRCGSRGSRPSARRPFGATL